VRGWGGERHNELVVGRGRGAGNGKATSDQPALPPLSFCLAGATIVKHRTQ
jgi:hypothetical protein